MKVFVGGVFHEANAFSPVPTPRSAFHLLTGSKNNDHEATLSGLRVGYEGFIDAVKRSGDTAVPGFFANATPSGPCSPQTFAWLRRALLRSIADAGEPDAVLLFLHGAQTSEDCDDCAGMITAQVRAHVGDDIPIGVLMDLHANVSEKLLGSADIVTSCKEYPHTDFNDSAEQLWRLLKEASMETMRCVWRPVPAFPAATTTSGPMASFLDRLRSAESSEGVLVASAIHGFPQADVPHGSAGILLYADANANGERIAEELADDFFSASIAAAESQQSLSPVAAVERAAMERQGPVVIAERSDNPGAGGAGDSTQLLNALKNEPHLQAVIGIIYDPAVAHRAAELGAGTQLAIEIGGHSGDLAGGPFPMNAKVQSVLLDAVQPNFGTEGSIPLGTSVLLSDGNLKVVVASERQQAFNPCVFTDHGISLTNQDVIVVKSTNHFYNGFAPLASSVLYCDGRGAGSENLADLPYKRLTRPVWPLDTEATCRAAMSSPG